MGGMPGQMGGMPGQMGGMPMGGMPGQMGGMPMGGMPGQMGGMPMGGMPMGGMPGQMPMGGMPGQMGGMPMGGMPGQMGGMPMGGMPMGATGAVQQTTTMVQGRGAVQQTTTTFAPVVQGCFGRPVQLYNHHAKFLCGGSEHPHGHHNPNHGYNQSSYWFIEPHQGFSDKVRLRNTNGRYLCHIGGSPFCSMHPVASTEDVAWHMDSFPGFGGQNVIFRSKHSNYLSLDKHDHQVHCKSHYGGGVHESQRFEIRFV